MQPIILFRDLGDWQAEKQAAEKHFTCIGNRGKIPRNSLIIPRYSALPFYKELEEDAKDLDAKLINSYKQHRYVANLGEWYEDLKEFTPKTWDRLVDLPEEGPFVLKGETNSKKNWWKTHCYAANKKEAIQVHSRLCEDSLIGEQNIYIRQYVPLYTYLKGIQDQPITKEFRFFVYSGIIISGGYYWSNYYTDIEEKIDINEVPIDFLNKIVNIVKEHINFFVMDVAQTTSGEWILIELNDGTMSGISENDPAVLYGNLKSVLEYDKDMVFRNLIK